MVPALWCAFPPVRATLVPLLTSVGKIKCANKALLPVLPLSHSSRLPTRVWGLALIALLLLRLKRASPSAHALTARARDTAQILTLALHVCGMASNATPALMCAVLVTA